MVKKEMEEGQIQCPFWENPFFWGFVIFLAGAATLGLIGHLRWYF